MAGSQNSIVFGCELPHRLTGVAEDMVPAAGDAVLGDCRTIRGCGSLWRCVGLRALFQLKLVCSFPSLSLFPLPPCSPSFFPIFSSSPLCPPLPDLPQM